MWTYRCYDDGEEETLWKRWYDSALDVQGSHTSVFDILEQQVAWREPWSKLIDKKERLIEIRLSGDVEWRIIGFYGSQQREFVVVSVCNHKGRVYDPKDALKTAAKRKKEIEQDPAKAKSSVRPK